MLIFKYGVSDGMGSVHFHDRIVGCALTVSDEKLYGLRAADGSYRVDVTIHDIDTITRCSVVEKEGFSVDEITGLIRVDFPAGSEVFIPDELIAYVQKEQKVVQFDCMRYSTVSYQYGTFDGRNRVMFNGFSLPAPEFYDTREGLYCIVDFRIVGRLDLSTTDIVHTVVDAGCVVVEDNPGIMVHSPIGCDVKLPRAVWFSMKERGCKSALFIPVHVNGDVDWIPENDSNLVRKSILNAFNSCKHLTGRARFEAMVPLLKGVEIFCLGDLVDDNTVDCYGVRVPCRVEYAKQNARCEVYFKDGKSLMMVRSTGYPCDVVLDSEYTVDDKHVYITDRPVEKGTLVKTTLKHVFGDVALIEVPPETTVPGFDIRPELQRLLDDAAYRKSVAADIQKVFMKLPPAQRNESEAIRQVCEFANTMCR